MLKKSEDAFLKAYLKKLGMQMSPGEMKQLGLSNVRLLAGGESFEF